MILSEVGENVIALGLGYCGKCYRVAQIRPVEKGPENRVATQTVLAEQLRGMQPTEARYNEFMGMYREASDHPSLRRMPTLS